MSIYYLDETKSKNSAPNAVTINSTKLRVTISDTTYHNSWAITNNPLPKDNVYWEVTIIKIGSETGGYTSHVGIGTINLTNRLTYYADRGTLYPGDRPYGSTYKEGDTIGVAYSFSNNTITFYKNGVSQGVVPTGIDSSNPVYPVLSNYYPSSAQFNFGRTEFKYGVPDGYRKLDSIERILVKNQNQYYSFKTTWIPIGQTITESDYITSGIDDISLIPETDWSKLTGEIELCYYTDDPNKTEAFFNIETEPFTLAEEFDDQTIKIIEYTDNPDQEDSIITLETEPFTFYDEVGDSFDVLYYTDDPDKTEAQLEISHNYSPLDELDGDFELVTWTMEEEAEVQEELKRIFKEKIEDGDLYGVTVDLSKGTINIK